MWKFGKFTKFIRNVRKSKSITVSSFHLVTTPLVPPPPPPPTMSSLSSSSIFRNNFPSTSITSSTLSVPALRRGTNFARLLSRWKIFQVAHFAQKTRFRFGLKFLAQKRSLLSLGIKRGATRSIMVKTTCVQKKRAGVSFLDGSQTFCGRREEKKL